MRKTMYREHNHGCRFVNDETTRRMQFFCFNFFGLKSRHPLNTLLLHTLAWIALSFSSFVSAADTLTLDQLSQTLNSSDSNSSHAILIRHALAPGTSDPENFKLDDCSTQRNLDDTGRAQAVQIGELLHQAGLSEIEIFTSQWCRCRDTAQLIAQGWHTLQKAGDTNNASITDLPALNSFFQARHRSEQQTTQLRSWLRQRKTQNKTSDGSTKLAILVTHQVNITALTRVYPSSGELVIVRISEKDSDQSVSDSGSNHGPDHGIEVIGTIETL